MPGGPNFPHDTSARYPASKREAIRSFRPSQTTQGIILDGNGDVRNWVTSAGVSAAQRDLITVLAYLDVADEISEDRHVELKHQLHAILPAIITQFNSRFDELNTTIATQNALIEQLASFMGVLIPAWLTLTEVEEGDEMGGIARPSASELGLQVQVVHRRQEQGFDHHDVVSIEPPAGALVARGSTVQVTINLLG